MITLWRFLQEYFPFVVFRRDHRHVDAIVKKRLITYTRGNLTLRDELNAGEHLR